MMKWFNLQKSVFKFTLKRFLGFVPSRLKSAFCMQNKVQYLNTLGYFTYNKEDFKQTITILIYKILNQQMVHKFNNPNSIF